MKERSGRSRTTAIGAIFLVLGMAGLGSTPAQAQQLLIVPGVNEIGGEPVLLPSIEAAVAVSIPLVSTRITVAPFFVNPSLVPLEIGTLMARNITLIGNGVVLPMGLILGTHSDEDVISNCSIQAAPSGTALDVRSSASIENCTIGGGSGGPAVLIDGSPTLEDCDIADHVGGAYGGGIRVKAGNPTLYSVTVARNRAGSGAGISVKSGLVTLTDVTLEDNVATDAGGGIHVGRDGEVRAYGETKVRRNEADQGGGVAVLGGALVARATEFYDNRGSAGGGVFMDAGEATLSDAVFTRNNANSGGGFYASGGVSNLSSIEFQNNGATTGGGAYLGGDDGSCSDCAFSDNAASLKGGGAMVVASEFRISSSTFLSNEAKRLGGGLASSSPSLTVDNTEFDRNEVTGGKGGGAASEGEGAARWSACSFLDNVVTDGGGGFYGSATSDRIEGSTFAGNQANRGAGFMSEDAGYLELENCLVAYNTADSDGGGGYNLRSTIQLERCEVRENIAGAAEAGARGGGLYNEESSGDLLDSEVREHNIVYDEVPISEGGGIYNLRCDLTISGCEIVENTARAGGGLYLNQGSDRLEGGAVADNHAFLGDGGGVFTSGSALRLESVDLLRNIAAYDGGGLRAGGGSITMAGGQTTENSAMGGSGGGLYLDNTSFRADTTIVQDNLAQRNGGGVWAELGSGEWNGLQVSSNEAAELGGGIYLHETTVKGDRGVVRFNRAKAGGGAFSDGTSATFSEFTLLGNQAAEADGGGWFLADSSSFVLDGGLVFNNIAPSAMGRGGGVYGGGGTEIDLSRVRLEANRAGGNGGGIFSDGDARIENCVVLANVGFMTGGMRLRDAEVTHSTIARNDGTVGGIEGYFSWTTLKNSIVWENAGEEIRNVRYVSYSCIQGGRTGNGNINQDPAFASLGDGDFHLMDDSPCIDTATEEGASLEDFEGTVRPQGIGYDMGAFEFPQDTPCDLVLHLSDYPAQVQRGEMLKFVARAENECGDARVLDQATLEVSGPASLLRTLYDGGEIGVGPGGEVGTEVYLAVPAGAPLGQYSVTVRILRDDAVISSEGFNVQVE